MLDFGGTDRRTGRITMAGTIFICYRRGDDTPSAGWLRALLIGEGTFEPAQVFLDVDGIEPGEDFVAVLEQQVAACDVLLCMIGRGWLNALDRLEQPQDYVRIEIAAALKTGKKVIPLLLDQARMPSADQLPEDIRKLTRRQAAWLRHDHFQADLHQLIPKLQKALPTPQPRPPEPPKVPQPPATTSETTALPPPQPRSPELPKVRQPPATTSRTAALPPPGTVFRDIDAAWCPDMVVIPAGTFLMGSPDNEEGRASDEGPQHRVTIAKPFAIGKFPVTFAEYDHFCEQTSRDKPSDSGAGRGRRPVINVSWEDAQAYVTWLSRETGKPYRLPTEAEWEYACRAGTTTRFAFGNKLWPTDATIAPSVLSALARLFQSPKTTEVGKHRSNAWGLYDMHGNVWEWCEDCWHDSYHGAPDDGRAWGGEDGGDCDRRVLRGGSWYDDQVSARAAGRDGGAPVNRDFGIGFRVVCSSPSSGH